MIASERYLGTNYQSCSHTKSIHHEALISSSPTFPEGAIETHNNLRHLQAAVESIDSTTFSLDLVLISRHIMQFAVWTSPEYSRGDGREDGKCTDSAFLPRPPTSTRAGLSLASQPQTTWITSQRYWIYTTLYLKFLRLWAISALTWDWTLTQWWIDNPRNQLLDLLGL